MADADDVLLEALLDDVLDDCMLTDAVEAALEMVLTCRISSDQSLLENGAD